MNSKTVIANLRNIVPNSRFYVLRSALAVFLLGAFCITATAENTAPPQTFSYSELINLYEQDVLSPEMEAKLSLLLTTPFVVNNYAKNSRNFSRSMFLGSYIRVASWNIERGLEYEAIEAAFGDAAKFELMLDTEKFPPGSDEREYVLEEAAALRSADIIILNEADMGMKRTDYRNIVGDLAAKLGMNYAFGVQFVELSPVKLSREQEAADDIEKEMLDVIRVDREKYKGLHGTAILSRFPLENVRLKQFKHQPYDWYASEKKGPGFVDKSKRQVAKRIFLEKTLREIRRGGRMMLSADISDERYPGGRLTVVATHLENRAKPAGRLKQLEEVLASIKGFRNPVVLAGDMNTSGQDLAPSSIGRELKKRFGNPKFWIQTGMKYAFGMGLLEDVILGGITFGRNHNDPTVGHVPFLLPNPERKFFTDLEKFRFDDGGVFDFRGEKDRSAERRSGTLSNSNERGFKGFVTTYRVNRPIKFIGKYKLDWIFVKPYGYEGGKTKSGISSPFAPHFGRTLRAIPEIVEDRISDHRPIIVDLPIDAVKIKIL
ncbi:MAG: endonuclease/exonuclease/phosphatase family protein [Pyrinomonadaceae bacterium]